MKMKTKIDWSNKKERKKYLKEYKLKYYTKNKKVILKKNEEYRKKNKIKFREYQKKYANKNKLYYKKKYIQWNKIRTLNGYNNIRQKKYAKRYPEKIKAHNFSNNKNLKGDFCEICNSTKCLEIHHLDYSNPKKILTLCRLHHNEIHTQ